MASPLTDPAQRDQFLDAAVTLGYKREDFGFNSSSAAEGERIVHHVVISHNMIRRRYVHGGNARWAADAITDLRAGEFGPPG